MRKENFNPYTHLYWYWFLVKDNECLFYLLTLNELLHSQWLLNFVQGLFSDYIDNVTIPNFNKHKKRNEIVSH